MAVVILGVGLVFAARSSRDEQVAPFRSDHWHSAYEVFDCGVSRSALQTQTDPDGIHTHGDGLLHIHPFNSSATGTDADLGVFFDASGLRIDDGGIDATGSFDAGFVPIDNSTGCDGADSEIVVTRWNVDGPDGLQVETTYRGDFADIRLLHEREAFTIAKVPVGEDAPAPSAAVLAQLDTSTGTTNLASEDIELPDLADTTTTGDPATTEAPTATDAPAEDTSDEGSSESDAE
jgi:hypothetical protein